MSTSGTIPASDDPREKEEIGRLCAQYLDYAVKQTRKYKADYPWLADDFESEATVALLKAVRSRHTFNGSLAGLIGANVSDACKQLVERERKRPDSPINAEPLPDDRRMLLPTRTGQIRHDRGALSDPSGLSLEMRDLLDTLSPAHRDVLTRYYLDGETQEEIAARRGVTREAVHYMVERALTELRSRLVSDDVRSQLEQGGAARD